MFPAAPWTTSGRAIVAASGEVVALVNPQNILLSPQGVPGSYDPQTRALLSVAPDMLALLETIVHLHAIDMPTWERANALIARARGDG